MTTSIKPIRLNRNKIVWYIDKIEREDEFGNPDWRYLHKDDLKWHVDCGIINFYDTYREAENDHNKVRGISEEFLTRKDMEI